MIAPSLMREKAGHEGPPCGHLLLQISTTTYHSPDLDMALSRFRTRKEAAEYAARLAAEVARRVEAVKSRVWSEELEKCLKELREALETFRRQNQQK